MVQILQLVLERQFAFPEITKDEMESWIMTPEVQRIVEGLCEKVKRDRAASSTAGVKRKGGQ